MCCKEEIGFSEKFSSQNRDIFLSHAAGPKIKKMLKEVACVVGKDLEYHVEVEGEPAPEMKW